VFPCAGGVGRLFSDMVVCKARTST